MQATAKLFRYPANIFRSWLRGGAQAIIDEVVHALRYHLGVVRLEEQQSVTASLLELAGSVANTWTVMNWIDQAVLEKEPLVSIILPTRNRAALLPRAVNSVCAQRYTRWELVITDDGSTDNTPVVLEQLRVTIGADRLNAERTANLGVCAARNHALARSRGEFIVYLDDDNAMHPLWLKAVVWAFSQFPSKDVGYGGRIVDDVEKVNGHGAGELPRYYIDAFDRSRLAAGNFVDIGQIAHRRGLAEAHFDEKLAGLGDWDLLLRLTRDKDPIMIPVIACLYSTSANGRLSEDPTFYEDIGRVKSKHGTASIGGR